MQRLLTFPNRTALWVAALAALAATSAFEYLFSLLNRPLAPRTIVDFEFAWNAARAAEMTGAWGEAGNAAARASLWLDFGFIPVYALLFASVTLFAARASTGRWQTLGLWLTLAPFAAGLFDAVENASLLSLLPPSAPADTPALLAGVCASLKFGLLLVCLAYILITLLMYLWRRFRPTA